MERPLTEAEIQRVKYMVAAAKDILAKTERMGTINRGEIAILGSFNEIWAMLSDAGVWTVEVR